MGKGNRDILSFLTGMCTVVLVSISRPLLRLYRLPHFQVYLCKLEFNGVEFFQPDSLSGLNIVKALSIRHCPDDCLG